ncbi:response regulator [Ideonella sp. BN130291]|uniref:response regulator n=1 Tax=Ideonella sp. BN130291 TaxID=3112940 RepID=UPI002E254D78|nr:response regulator [Ideonella sp. BN130291]
MHALDRHIADCRGLVVDANPTSRSILAAQLRDLGVGTVAQCSKATDARRLLENREFEFVLCEQHFPNDTLSGQDLLDDLRRAQLLPFSTVFIMITGEATYGKVAEAAESALDGYLLKPHTATGLAERLRHARERKRVLREIFEAMEDQQFEVAARMCLQRFHDRSPYWLYAARIGAELLLRLQQHAAAQKLYEAVIATQALPWARLGVARVQLEGGQLAPARRTLESLIAQEPSYADAYDVMGRVQVEQGQLDDALATYRQASELTPGSIMRLQKHGMLAFYLGDHEQSAKALERASALGINSKTFDFQSMVLLAFARFQQRDGKGLQRCLDNLQHALDKAPQSRRLQRFAEVARTLHHMQQKQVASVVNDVRALAAEIAEPDFDLEAACNMLALVSRLTAAELRLDEAEGWIDAVALRFCTAKGVSELLARSAGGHPPYAERVRQCHARIHEIAEQCMAHTVAGDPAATVKQLLVHGSRTGNTKLIDMARLTLQRHHAAVADAAELAPQLEALQRRYAGAVNLPLGQDGGRSAGGLNLRTGAAEPVAPVQALKTAPPGPRPHQDAGGGSR